MKCPKCGSEMKCTDKYPTIISGYICVNSKCEQDYKARLDKVLSNMKSYKKISNHKFYYVGDSKISIEFNNGKFYLEDRDERQVRISLDTVESLIKDLEAQK